MVCRPAPDSDAGPLLRGGVMKNRIFWITLTIILGSGLLILLALSLL